MLTAPAEPRPHSRSLLLGGLRLLLTRPRLPLWFYGSNLLLALLFSFRLHAQLATLLSHSLASQRLTSAFDLGVLGTLLLRLNRDGPAAGAAGALPPLLYLLLTLVLVPGALFACATDSRAKLAEVLGAGAQHFWRFVRIALLTLIVGGLCMAPMLLLQGVWSDALDARTPLPSTPWLQLLGYLPALMVAVLLRTYFDLVESYTVLLGQQIRPNGKPDRRVRRTLLPAFRTLRHNLLRATETFLLLGTLAVVFFAVLARFAITTLAQARSWPLFVLLQAGIFVLQFMRLWQRTALMSLALQNPLPNQPQADLSSIMPEPTQLSVLPGTETAAL